MDTFDVRNGSGRWRRPKKLHRQPYQSRFRKREQVHQHAFYHLQAGLEQSDLHFSGVDPDEPARVELKFFAEDGYFYDGKHTTTVEILVGTNQFRTLRLLYARQRTAYAIIIGI
jgi:hypothetical protein